jgi:error-prone DNA polymerase
LWEVSTKDHSQALFAGQQPADANGENVNLPLLLPSEHVVQDYVTTSLSLKAHPVSFVRTTLDQLQVLPAKELSKAVNGQPVKVAGLVLVRQRPGTAKGVWFITIEDETGVANLVLFPNLVQQFRKVIINAKLFMVEGTLQVEGAVIHVIVNGCYDLSKLLRRLVPVSGEDPSLQTLSRADEKPSVAGADKQSGAKVKREETLFPEARNFK